MASEKPCPDPDCNNERCDGCVPGVPPVDAIPHPPDPPLNGLLPGLPEPMSAPPEPEVVHVRYHVEHVLVPMVIYDACKCGRTRRTPNEGALGFASMGEDMPPTVCSCGRVIIGEKRRIEVVQ